MSGSRIVWRPPVERVESANHNALREPRIGVMLHYDGSLSDRGAVSWFKHPKCKVSYQDLALDDGTVVEIAPEDRRAWHAGVCRPSDPRLVYRDANSAFYGIAAATTDGVDVTPAQLISLAWLTRRYFEANGWPLSDTWRIVGHHTEAWKRGRKTDPIGATAKNPIFSVADVVALLPLVQP